MSSEIYSPEAIDYFAVYSKNGLGMELICLFSNKTTNYEGDFESIEDLGYYTKKLTDEERNELRAEGFAEGFAEGYAEGRAEIERVMLLSVKYLRSENLTLDEISKILDIPIQKVLEIQQRLDRKL